MELRDFVSETLKQVIDGIARAQEHAAEAGAVINPPLIVTRSSGVTVPTVWDENTSGPPHYVEFDVALTKTEGDQLKGGIGVFFAGIGVGTQAKSSTTSGALNRIKFSVPVRFPTQRGRSGESA